MHEREAEAQENALAVMHALYPGVIGNPFIPHWPHPKQMAVLGAHVRAQLEPGWDPDEAHELLFGGAAGGGKSEVILDASVQYVDRPNFSAVCIRRTHAELAKPGALMSRAHERWTKNLGVRWDGTNKIFTFPSGAQVQMGYHGTETDNQQYQGAEYQQVSFDELTHWPDPIAYEWIVLSRMRRNTDSDIPLRAISASNPGGPGHVWVRDRFPGTVGKPGGKLYIPSTIDDNPSLDRNAYIRSLSQMHPTVRDQLLRGDWRARDPGDYFRAEWFGPLLKPEQLEDMERIRVRWWDLAASESRDAARTAGVLMSRLRHGVRVIEHARAFRATPGRRDAEIMRQARLDGRDVIIGLELEGGSGGPAQVEAIETVAKREGYRVVWARPKVDLTDAEGRTMMRSPIAVTGKAGRAAPVASCLERGFQRRAECPDIGEPWYGEDEGKAFFMCNDGLRLVMGRWTQEYLDEVEGFPDGALLDFADATSGAWAWLEAHPYGLRTAPAENKDHQPAELQNVHPDDRPALPPVGVGSRSRARGRHGTPSF